MDMKKKILLSMILLALCLIQASADTYYFKINLYNQNGQLEGWSSYIKVEAIPDGQNTDGTTKYSYPNGLQTLLDGGSVKDEGDGNGNDIKEYKLPKTTDGKVDLDRIYGIVFANGKGRGIFTSDNKQEENILEGYEFDAWTKIREHIKYLELREYKCDTYNNSGYFMNMHKVEALELPKDGMTVGDGDTDGELYFANADKLKTIYIYSTKGNNDKVEITDYITDTEVAAIPLLNRVGKQMFSNCYSLSTKYINRLIRNVTEIKDEAFYAGNEHRGEFSNDEDNKMAIEIPTSETEVTKVTKIGDQAFYNRQKVTGLNINGNGCLEIGSEAFRGCDELHDLSLNNAKITSLGTGVFRDCRSMTKEFVKGVLENYAANANGEKKIPAYLFYGCNGQNGHSCTFTELDIPASFTGIEKAAFADNPQVTKVKVHSGTQIDARDEDGIFSGMEPNKVQVVFEDGAKDNDNYKNYRNDINVGNGVYKENAFMFLLTKTLNEDDDDYTVVAQRHANVRLKRKFKEGWNTLVLPFGARVIGDWRVDAAEIFKNALNATGNKDFMIAAYRGLAKNDKNPDNSTFYFLKYDDYDKPIDEFEPLLVRMTQQDIDNANANGEEEEVYTFEDVELNYDGDNDTEYTAEGAKERMGKKHTGDYFDGNYDHDKNDKFGKCSYVDFYFTGTLYKQQGTAVKNSAFIAPGDYIIQNNTFVKCFSNKTYGLKGFRGYFKQKPSGETPSETSGAKGIGICLVDSNGVVSSIHQVDGVSLTPASVAPAAVYNLSGQKVGNSLSTLAKGVYIVNGKKFVKK